MIQDNHPDAPVMGKLYYEMRRSEYEWDSSPSKLLSVKDSEQVVNEMLQRALEGVVVSQKKFEAIDAFFETGQKVNQKSFVMLARASLRCSPYTTVGNCQYNLRFMAYLVRTGMDKEFQDEVKHLNHHFDATLERSLSLFKRQDWGKSTWWAKYKAVASLVLPAETVVQPLFDVKPGQDFDELEENLTKVCESSITGERLFGAALAVQRSKKQLE